jgi:hypothetical protein
MLGWVRNPLRRRIDRVEAAMIAGLIAVFLISAPVLAAVARHCIGSAAMREQRAEAAWRLVPATVQGGGQRMTPRGQRARSGCWHAGRRRMGRRVAAGFRSSRETRQAVASGCGSPARAR